MKVLKEIDLSLEEKQIVEEYHKNEMYKLKQVCDPLIYRKGVPKMYYDDLYDIASDVLLLCVKNYDNSNLCSFKSYFIKNIKSAFYDWTRDNRRGKRCNLERDKNGKIKKDNKGNPIVIHNISLDVPTEDGIDLTERIDSGFNIEEALPDEMIFSNNEKIERYLKTLSTMQRKIAELIMQGFNPVEIREKLNIPDKEYNLYISDMKSYEKKRILYKDRNVEENFMDTTMLSDDITETYKNTSYSIDSISKQLQKKRIRDDHILQRHSGQWKGFAKSELISDILRGKSLTQIIISEEIKNGLRMQWLIDGKQRCTTLDDFLHDGFAISKNVKNYNIRYQTIKVDEEGNEVLNEDGFTEIVFKEFDIRGKKFSQLPEELQEIFKDRQIPVLYNMNCTKKDIADDIARFNRSRPMNKAQNGWLGLDESFAEFVENIVKMPFFQIDFDGSSYTSANHTSGIIRRIVVEGIMVSDFIDEFDKDFNKMCEFLTNEASDSNFTQFYSLIDRLTNVCNKSVADFFNAKDSFLWFALFSKFTETGLEDNKFIEFLTEFSYLLHSKEINGITYDDLCFDKKTGKTKATKDKNIVISKIELLEELMYEYFGLTDIQKNNNENIESAERIIREYIDTEVTEDDIELFEICTNDMSEVIDVDSELLSEKNRPSLVALVAYAFKEEKDKILNKWFYDYEQRNKTHISDQKENFLHMKKDLQNYIDKREEEDNEKGSAA